MCSEQEYKGEKKEKSEWRNFRLRFRLSRQQRANGREMNPVILATRRVCWLKGR